MYGNYYQSPYNPYQPMQYSNPYAQAQQPQQEPKPFNDTLIRVNGRQGAEAYPLTPNSRAALFDGNDMILYIKQTDAGGFPTLDEYDIIKRDGKKPETEYATKADLAEMEKNIRKELLSNGKPVQRGKQSATAESDGQ